MSDRKQLCVYTHSANGQIFYVGCGGNRRPYDYSHSRNQRWRDYVSSIKEFETTICIQTDDRTKAMNVERMLIAHHKPACNIRSGGSSLPIKDAIEQRVFHVRLTPEAREALIKAGEAAERPAAWLAQKAIVAWLKAEGWLKLTFSPLPSSSSPLGSPVSMDISAWPISF